MKKLIFSVLLFVLYIWVSFSYNWDLQGVKIISRTEWLADKKYLFKDYKAYQDIIKNNEELNEKIKQNPSRYKTLLEKRAREKQREKYLLKNWKSEIKVDKVIKKLDWKELRWPISYKYHKTKIIIHHTASLYSRNKTKEDVEKFLRWIYYYHAIKRWWGDIWYNFIIDHFGNIYEWRIGWQDVVWANTKRNNVPSIWIVLIWNFQVEKPTKAQVDSLIKLATAVAKKYNIHPYKKQTYHISSYKYPYMKDIQNYSIIGHKDAGHTLCPWKYLYYMLPYIRKKVSENLHSVKLTSYKKPVKTLNLWYKFTLDNNLKLKISWTNLQDCSSSSTSFAIFCKDDEIYLKHNYYEKFWIKTIIAHWNKFDYKINFKPIWMSDIRYLMQKKAEKYLWNHINSHSITKVSYKNYKNNIKNLINKWVSVLLYELSNFTYFNISCSNSCIVKTDKTTYYTKSLKIDKISPLMVWLNNKSINTRFISIKDAKNWLVYFNNYKRKSYAKIPWNNFHWTIIIKKDYIKQIWWKVKYDYVVVNNVSFNDYLNWISESNDQMPFEKIKVMALLAKSYILFYANKKNVHPSIPKKSSYNAVDDPRIFQKYVWAWYEKTSRLWKKALKAVDNELVFYKNYVPILPYFSCSKGFTFSAKQKFWREDTPYLTNNLDLWKCNKFRWHGVWLSGKWAEFLAKKWLNYKQIIKWYFPWTVVEKY